MKGNFHAGFGEKRAETRLWQHRKVRCVLTLSVYSGALGDDWDLSLAHLAHLEARGILPIGIYLGQDSGDIEKLKRLFPRPIVTAPQQLPERLGDVFRALAG